MGPPASAPAPAPARDPAALPESDPAGPALSGPALSGSDAQATVVTGGASAAGTGGSAPSGGFSPTAGPEPTPSPDADPGPSADPGGASGPGEPGGPGGAFGSGWPGGPSGPGGPGGPSGPGGPGGPGAGFGSGPVPPPPPYGPPVRRLRRSKQRRVVAGVASGLGDYTGIDPVLIRVLFAVLTVFGGAGILLYVVGWLFLPEDDQRVSPAESLIGRGTGSRRGELVRAALLVVAGLILAGVLAAGDAGDVILVMVVVGGAVLLARNLDERRDGRPPGPQPPLPTYQPYEQQPYAYQPYEAYDPTRTTGMPIPPGQTATAVYEPPPPPPAPVKERSVLGRLTLSVLLLVLGVTAALDAAGAVAPQARHYLALAVGVLGLGLVIGAWLGRARGLVWLGIPLTVALVAVSTAEVSLDGGSGDRRYRPQSVAEIQGGYRVGVGNIRLDLSDVDFAGQSVTANVSAGIGNVEVLVPREVDVDVVGRAGIGEADLFGRTSDGGSSEQTGHDEGPDGEGGGRLQLVLDVGVGRVEVDRAAS